MDEPEAPASSACVFETSGTHATAMSVGSHESSRKPMDYSELSTIDDVANYLGVPKQTIYSWRHTG